LLPVVGGIIRLDDVDTGFSPQNPKEGRRYVVIEVRNARVRVVPFCRKARAGIFIEPGTLSDPEASGWFIRWSANISADLAERAEHVEHLAMHHVEKVRSQWLAAPGPPAVVAVPAAHEGERA
jgi:hypothetical protein